MKCIWNQFSDVADKWKQQQQQKYNLNRQQTQGASKLEKCEKHIRWSFSSTDKFPYLMYFHKNRFQIFFKILLFQSVAILEYRKQK